MSSTRIITLNSSDNDAFKVNEAVALQSQTIKHMIEDGCADDSGIPLPNVTSKTLAMIIEYCKKHAEATSSEEKLSKDEVRQLDDWDTEFVKVDIATLYDLIRTANYLNIKNLLELTCKTLAEMIRGKTTEEIRKILHIQNDFTLEEEQQIKEENKWAFE